MPKPARKTKIVVDKDLTIDFSRREVWVRGQKVSLRPTEYRLLYHLVNNAGRLTDTPYAALEGVGSRVSR